MALIDWSISYDQFILWNKIYDNLKKKINNLKL